MGYDFAFAKSGFVSSSAALRSKRTNAPTSATPTPSTLPAPSAPSAPIKQKGATRPFRPYRTIGILKTAGLDKDLGGARDKNPVPYMSKAERQRYNVTVGSDGCLYQRRPGVLVPMRMDTSGASNPADAYLFAMDHQGNIFAAASGEVKHHSAFFAGGPGAAFGTIVVKDGRLLQLSDQSGHYAPPRDYSLQFIAELERRKTDISSTEVRCRGRKKSELKKINADRGVKFQRMYPDGLKLKQY